MSSSGTTKAESKTMVNHVPDVEFAPVAPAHILEELLDWDPKYGYGRYHLFLAHATVAKRSDFGSLVKRHYAIRPFDLAIYIMDNSLVELGGAVDDKMIADAVQIVKSHNPPAQVIPVLPDSMGKGKETRELSHDAYNRWESIKMPSTDYMLVTQGETWEDFCTTVNDFFLDPDEYPRISWVGIPRVLTKAIHTRARAIQYVQMVAPHVNIHLLGFSNDIADDLFCSRIRGVRGIDSAVPIRYNDILTPLTSDEEIGPRNDWWEKGVLTDRQKHNLIHVRRWIRNRIDNPSA